MAEMELFTSLNEAEQTVILGLAYPERVKAIVSAAADRIYGGLHILHESWSKHQFALIYHYSPQFIEGTLFQAIKDQHLPVDFRDYLAQIKALSRNGHPPSPKAEHVFRGQTLETLMQTYYPEPNWAVDGLVPEGCFILAGKPKHGKSYLALTIALAVAKHQKCLDYYHVSGGDVLCFSLEDYAKRVQKRINRLYSTTGSRHTIEFFYNAPKMSEGFGERLKDTLSQRPSVRLVIIDTLRCIRDSQKEQYNLYQEDSDFIGGLNEMAQNAGTTILIVHHTRKAKSDDVFDEISGTGGLRGSTSGNMVLQEISGEADGMLIIEGKDFEHRLNVALKRKDDGSWSYAGEGEVYQLRANKRAVLRAIETLGDSANPKDIWTESGIHSFGTVRSILARMASLGEVGKSRGNVYFVIAAHEKDEYA